MDVEATLKMTAAMLMKQYGQERAIRTARSSQRQQDKLGNKEGVAAWKKIIRHIENGGFALTPPVHLG